VPNKWPLGLRSALAAGLIALVLLTGGALWLRATIAGLDRERTAARIASGQAVVSALKDTLQAGKPLPELETPYEIVGSNGQFVPVGNTEMRELEGVIRGPLVPAPSTGAPSGTQVLTAGGWSRYSELRTVQWPLWTVVAETIPTPPDRVAQFGDRLRVNVFITRTDEDPLPALDRVLWPGVPGAALLVALVGWIATHQALRPVEQIRRQTAEISEHALNHRIRLPGKWLRSWSIGVRAAVAAGLISALPFIFGALWLRHVVDETSTARMMAYDGASLSASEATKAVAPLGKSIPDSPFYHDIPANPARDLDRVLWPGIPAGIVLVALVAWGATTRALAPVEKIRKQTAEISDRALNLRVPVPPTRDAIARLAVTLNETLDRLEKSVHAQRQFIADAAHELRSPIASLRTVLEVAADHPETADWPAVVGDAVIDTQRLQTLAEDLLLLAKLDSAQPLHLTQVDLAGMVRAELSTRDKVSMRTNGPAPLKGDPGQLSRLLRNLVDNAERHATKEITVTVRSTPLTVTLEVADDGPGIAREHRERVFDRFTRLDESRDSGTGGTGLGLAIAREIAHVHGGSLVVGEQPLGELVGQQQQGTVFVAQFPRVP
jgi:signal transduction histidine kinase